jgi:hypothetical protein
MNLIAKARHTLRPHRTYVVKLTLPVPKGTFIPPTTTLPLAIVGLDGRTLRTNVDAVSFYPNAAVDGADVVELQARIRNPQRLTTEVDLEIVQVDQHRVRPRIDQDVLDTLLNDRVRLVAEDVFGNTYSASLGRVSGRDFDITKYGPAQLELVKYTHLEPEQFAGPEALERLLGVHAVWKVWDRDKAIGLDLHIHNGESGLEDNAPNATVYFKSLELWIPDTHALLHKDQDPSLGMVTFDGGFRKYELIKPLEDGKMNAIRQRGALLRRFAITPANILRRAESYVNNRNMAFCKEGEGLWSWWSVGNWATTGIKLPPMPYAEQIARDYYSERYESIRESLRTGEAGEWGYQTPALGYAKPWGVQYQGMTGGEGITFVDGTLVAQAASIDGYNTWDLEFRMNLDRMPVGIWNLGGKHTEFDQWVQEGPNGTYIPSTFYHRPPANNDMFGFSDADETHVNYVEANGLVPDYQEELFGFMSHDLQHYSRWTRTMRPLIWLGNDTVAKLMSQAAGNIAKMSCIPHYNSAGGYLQGFSMLRFSQLPADLGGMFGRDGGWMIDAINMYYAVAPTGWRQRTLDDWYRFAIDTIDHVQVPCNGATMGNDTAGILDNKYRSAQTNETSILMNGLHSALTRVFDGVDEDMTEKTKVIIQRAVDGLRYWASRAENEGPRFQVAVTTLDSQTVFCTAEELPDDGYNEVHELTLSWQSWAVAYLWTGDETFMQKALAVAQNTSDWEPWMQTLADYESVRWSEQSYGQNLPAHILLYQVALENGF